MYKIRNIKHQAILDSLVGTIALGCSELLSKRTLKKLYIISSHAFESKGRTESEFKEWLYSLHPIVEELPAGTFKDAGTDVRTYMISLVK